MGTQGMASAHTTSTVLDLAYNQQTIQWQKIGNMQSSAGSILTVISIISSLMIGIITQVNDITMLLRSLGIFVFSFYISLLFSLIYLIISAYFVFQIIKPKEINVLENPELLQENILAEVLPKIEGKDDSIEIELLVDTTVLLKIDDEIKSTEGVLVRNQMYYKKCLKASFLSLIVSFITLGHVVSRIFTNNCFYITIVGILGYLSILGLIFIFLGGKK
jgi:hypothetical protein